MGELSRAEIDAFLAERRTLVLATLRPGGQPHLTTVWYRWDGESFWISTNRDRQKYRNLQRDPRIAVLVDDPAHETSVSAEAIAQPAAFDDDAYDGALAIVARYVEDPRAYLAERAGEPRVLVRIKPVKLVSWKP
jgi:PPOX class probable F420-dependent enzyme